MRAMAAMEKAQSERALAQPRAPPTGLGDYRSGLGSSATTVLPLAAPRHLVSSEALEGDCRRCMLALEGAIQGMKEGPPTADDDEPDDEDAMRADAKFAQPEGDAGVAA